jgi:hypothetical protein
LSCSLMYLRSLILSSPFPSTSRRVKLALRPSSLNGLPWINSLLQCGVSIPLRIARSRGQNRGWSH